MYFHLNEDLLSSLQLVTDSCIQSPCDSPSHREELQNLNLLRLQDKQGKLLSRFSPSQQQIIMRSLFHSSQPHWDGEENHKEKAKAYRLG